MGWGRVGTFNIEDMMLQQSTLAAAKRVVRRMEWGWPSIRNLTDWSVDPKEINGLYMDTFSFKAYSCSPNFKCAMTWSHRVCVKHCQPAFGDYFAIAFALVSWRNVAPVPAWFLISRSSLISMDEIYASMHHPHDFSPSQKVEGIFTAFLQNFDPARLEVHDPAALVACCQQLVECSVGIRPEAWGPGTLCRNTKMFVVSLVVWLSARTLWQTVEIKCWSLDMFRSLDILIYSIYINWTSSLSLMIPGCGGVLACHRLPAAARTCCTARGTWNNQQRNGEWMSVEWNRWRFPGGSNWQPA